MLAVDRADVERPAVAVQAQLDGGGDVLRYAEVRGEEVGGSRGQDGDDYAGTRDDVDAPLHHAVAPPHEDQIRARAQGLS